eukprot:1410808-Prymnesium_polylepis.1
MCAACGACGVWRAARVVCGARGVRRAWHAALGSRRPRRHARSSSLRAPPCAASGCGRAFSRSPSTRGSSSGPPACDGHGEGMGGGADGTVTWPPRTVTCPSCAV